MTINHSLLETARESRCYTQKEAAIRIGISQAKLSKAERGEQTLGDDMLEKVAQAYDYPVSFFYGNQDSSPEGHMYFRRRLSGSAKLYASIIAKTKILKRAIDELAPSVDLPECKFQPFDTQLDTPEEIARKTRYLLGIYKGRMPNLTTLIEANGIIIISFDFGTDKLDGLSTITSKGYKVIFMNSEMPNDRKRFSLAHELGHMIMHMETTPKFPEEVENEANRFASELLMPCDEIRNSLYKLNLGKLADLKRSWHVSIKSLIYRAHALKTITDQQNRNWQINYSKNGYNKEEPVLLPKEKPQLMAGIINLFKNELSYDDQDLMHMTNINRNDFNEYFMSAKLSFKLTEKEVC